MPNVFPPSSHNARCQLAETGCYLEWDAFGNDGLYPLLLYTPGDVSDKATDLEMIKQIIQLISEGYLNSIFISQDICWKIHLTRYGGMGYSHILNNIIPLMRQKGVTEAQINTIMVENPKRALSPV